MGAVADGSHCVDYPVAADTALGHLAWRVTAFFTDGGKAAVPGLATAFAGTGGVIGSVAGDVFC